MNMGILCIDNHDFSMNRSEALRIVMMLFVKRIETYWGNEVTVNLIELDLRHDQEKSKRA